MSRALPPNPPNFHPSRSFASRIFCALLFSHLAFAADPAPTVVKQGQVLRLQSKQEATATFRKKTIRYFKQPDGQWLGLLPIPVLAEPGQADLVVRDTKGTELEKRTLAVVDGGYRYQNIRATSSMKSIEPDPDEFATMRKLENYQTPERRWQEPLQMPTNHCQSSPFGNKRMHNGVLTGSIHRGVDLRAPLGTPVHAIAGGTVRVARKFSLQGGTVGIDHGQTVTSNYIHLSKILKQDGDVVEQGDVIGEVGSTGFSTGPHLHWGITVNGEAIDPSTFGMKATPCGPRAPAKAKPKAKRRK